MPSWTRSSAISGVMAQMQEDRSRGDRRGGDRAARDRPAQPSASASRPVLEPLIQQDPAALLKLNQHARALIDAVKIAGLEIIDAMGADDVLRAFHRVL